MKNFVIVVLICFIIGIVGGVGFSYQLHRDEAGGSPNIDIKRASRPLFDLGVFQITVPDRSYETPGKDRMIYLDISVQVANEGIFDDLNKSQKYWRDLFRNEIIRTAITGGANYFKSSEGLSKFSQKVSSSLNHMISDQEQQVVEKILFKECAMN